MSDKSDKNFSIDINVFKFKSSISSRQSIFDLTIGFFTIVSIYYLYIEHIFNEFLALGILGIGILLALIVYEKLVDRLVSKLPFTELNGRRVYILSSNEIELFITPTLKPKIIVTDTTLNSFSGEELEALLEHELGHIRLKHNLLDAIFGIHKLTLYIGAAGLFGIPSLFYFLYATHLFPSTDISSLASFFSYLHLNFGSGPLASVLSLLLFIEIFVAPFNIYNFLVDVPVHNITQKEADWYAVNKVGKEANLRVLNKFKQEEEEAKKEIFSIIRTETKPSFLMKVLLFRLRHPKLYWLDNYIINKLITYDERINIIESGSYEPFSYKETIKFLSPIIFLISVVASVTFTYTISSFVNFDYIFSYIFLIILNLVVLFSTMVLLMVLSSIIYFILKSLGIKEYLARTSIMAYYVITSLFFLFPGVIEGIIINLVGVTVAVLISSSEGKLGRAIIGWSLVYIISLIGALSLLTSLRVV